MIFGTIIGGVFLIASFIYWNNTENVVPRVIRIIITQIGIFVGLYCINLDWGLI